METNFFQALGRLLIVSACGVVPGTALATCADAKPSDCDETYVFDGFEKQESIRAWLSFTIPSEAQPLTYDVPLPEVFPLSEGLRFELPTDGSASAGFGDGDKLTLRADGEPAFAFLFGNVARLHTDGTMALGRGDERSNSPENLRNQWSDLLPAAYAAWNDRLDVDLGLSYAGQGHFSTSVGFAEKIGTQNDPAVVGWFEYRF